MDGRVLPPPGLKNLGVITPVLDSMLTSYCESGGRETIIPGPHC